MKYYGNTPTNDRDMVDKKYVDDNSGGTTPNDGSLILATDSNQGSSLFTANQLGTSKLIFVSGTGISLTQENSSITITNTGSGSTPNDGILQVAVPANNSNSSYSNNLFTANQLGNSSLSFQAGTGISITGTTGQSGSSTITITNTGAGGSGGYYKYSISTASENPLSIPISYKNVVVKFYYSNISTPGGSGNGKSYILSLDNKMIEGNEMFIYLRNVGDTAGVNVQIPPQFTFTVDNKTVNYPVVYNGYYNTQTISNDNPTNLIYNTTNPSYSAVTYHVFFDGEVYYINRLHYYVNSPNV